MSQFEWIMRLVLFLCCFAYVMLFLIVIYIPYIRKIRNKFLKYTSVDVSAKVVHIQADMLKSVFFVFVQYEDQIYCFDSMKLFSCLEVGLHINMKLYTSYSKKRKIKDQYLFFEGIKSEKVIGKE